MADELAEAPGVRVAAGRDAEALEEPVLLLLALGIPHSIEPEAEQDGDSDGVALWVPALHAERALKELAGLGGDRGHEHVAPALLGGARAGLPAAIALLVGHALLFALPAARRGAIYAAGELDAARVHAGEVFRAVTALTLHADFAHVLGNAVATAIFVSATGDWIGPGLALLLTVAAGALGNLGAALLDPGHHALGFSTATFGALGLTSVIGFFARYRDRHARRRAWLALGAGLALLALLGAGERSDLLAHILGLVCGALLGVLASGRARVGRALGPLGQLASATVAVALVAVSWLAALGGSR